MVVDDNGDQADSIATLLEIWGFEPIVAYDGASGLALAKTHFPSAVVLDLGLPGGLNGYQLASALREECHLDHTLIIAISGYAQEEDQQRSVQAGCDRHLAKPADPEVILHLLKNHFEFIEKRATLSSHLGAVSRLG